MYQKYFNVYDPSLRRYTWTIYRTLSITGYTAAKINQDPNGMGSWVVDTAQPDQYLIKYIDEMGNWDLSSHLVTTGHAYTYFSDCTRVEYGTCHLDDSNTGCAFTGEYCNDILTETWYIGWDSYQNPACQDDRSDLGSTWCCLWPSKGNQTTVLFVRKGIGADSMKYFFSWRKYTAPLDWWKMAQFTDEEDEIVPDDPFPDDDTDDIGEPTEPPIGILSTKMVHAYKMSSVAMESLSNELWNVGGSGFIDTIGKFFNDPAQAIIGITILPVKPSTSASDVNIKIGNWVSGNVQAPFVTDEYVTYDCGSLTWYGNYGSYLDYGPYTSVEIFLPFIGTKTLAIEDAQNAKISLKYRFNVITGNCVAYITITKTGKGESKDVLNSLMYQFQGNCNMIAPVSSVDYHQRVSAFVGMVTGIQNGLATTAVSAVTGNVGGIVSGSIAAKDAAVDGLMSMTLNYRTNGTISADSGILSSFTPYLIITKPNAYTPSGWKHDIGRKSNVTQKVGSCTGFNKYYNIHVKGVRAPQDEIYEIEKILKGGFLIG